MSDDTRTRLAREVVAAALEENRDVVDALKAAALLSAGEPGDVGLRGLLEEARDDIAAWLATEDPEASHRNRPETSVGASWALLARIKARLSPAPPPDEGLTARYRKALEQIANSGAQAAYWWKDVAVEALAAPAPPEAEDCGNCHRCLEGKTDGSLIGLPLTASRMILCPTCGNKRCPKASDHRLDCTGSNAAGQPGSVFAATQVEREPSEGLNVVVGLLPTMNQDPYPGLPMTWVQLRNAADHDQVVARVYGDDPTEALVRAQYIAAALRAPSSPEGREPDMKRDTGYIRGPLINFAEAYMAADTRAHREALIESYAGRIWADLMQYTPPPVGTPTEAPEQEER